MKNNVGKTDKIIRLVLGISIIAAGVFYSSWLGLLGVGIMIPAALDSDPLYNVMGVNTNKK